MAFAKSFQTNVRQICYTKNKLEIYRLFQVQLFKAHYADNNVWSVAVSLWVDVT